MSDELDRLLQAATDYEEKLKKRCEELMQAIEADPNVSTGFKLRARAYLEWIGKGDGRSH